MLALLLLSSTLAAAGTPAPGSDLAAWRAIRAAPTRRELLDFVREHPRSPLSELAWGMLVQQGRAPAGLRYARIRATWRDHQRILARVPASRVVATIEPVMGSEPLAGAPAAAGGTASRLVVAEPPTPR